MPKKRFMIKDSELDDYQYQVLNKKIDLNLLVQGCAGSGKSILALWRAKRIQNEKKGSYLFIVFTSALKQYMLEGIKEIGINENNVMTHEEWKRNGFPEADYIIVDEVQDFSLNDIDIFQSKTKKAFSFYGDSAQQLYEFLKDSKKTASILEISNHTSILPEQLIFNHRLPKKIARIVEHMLTGNDKDYIEKRCKNEGERKPKILKYNHLDDQLDAISQIILNGNMDDVGILFPSNEQVEYAYNYLTTKSSISIEVKYNKKNFNTSTLNFSSENPKILTYHSAKGLQFENVFLPECSCDHGFKNPLYVAMTRSYDGLYVMHSGNLSPLFKDIPSNLYDVSLESDTIFRL